MIFFVARTEKKAIEKNKGRSMMKFGGKLNRIAEKEQSKNKRKEKQSMSRNLCNTVFPGLKELC